MGSVNSAVLGTESFYGRIWKLSLLRSCGVLFSVVSVLPCDRSTGNSPDGPGWIQECMFMGCGVVDYSV